MAPLGGPTGGGQALGSGGSFTGPAEALEIVGDFAYAASGSIQDSGSDAPDTTLLSFTTGNYTFVGTLDFTNTVSSTHNIYLNMTFNDAVINETKESSSGIVPMRFHYIIPAYTEITVKWGAGTTANGSCFMAGRIYRG